MSANQFPYLALDYTAARSDSSEALQQLIDGKRLTPLFQPIVALEGGRIVGYEALIRGPEGIAYSGATVRCGAL